ncbi:MAG: YceI family protein [Bacteroidales bacterium]|nr:YceI family protein [Bacteroidales bacterium]
MKPVRAFSLLIAGFSALIFAGSIAQTDNNTKILRYQVDTQKSLLHWRCDQHYGTVPFEKGYFSLTNGQMEEGSFLLKMDSLKDADIDYKLMRDVLENILRSKDFFNTANYPFASFEIYSSSFNHHGKGYIQGDLTLRDVTKCISFGAAITHNKGGNIHIQTDSIRIDRTNWGIFSLSPNHVHSEESFIVSDTIVISLSVVADEE